MSLAVTEPTKAVAPDERVVVWHAVVVQFLKISKMLPFEHEGAPDVDPSLPNLQRLVMPLFTKLYAKRWQPLLSAQKALTSLICVTSCVIAADMLP